MLTKKVIYGSLLYWHHWRFAWSEFLNAKCQLSLLFWKTNNFWHRLVHKEVRQDDQTIKRSNDFPRHGKLQDEKNSREDWGDHSIGWTCGPFWAKCGLPSSKWGEASAHHWTPSRASLRVWNSNLPSLVIFAQGFISCLGAIQSTRTRARQLFFNLLLPASQCLAPWISCTPIPQGLEPRGCHTLLCLRQKQKEERHASMEDSCMAISRTSKVVASADPGQLWLGWFLYNLRQMTAHTPQ